MVCPVFLDGPLEGEQHEVSTDAVEQGIWIVPGGTYTFHRIGLLDKVFVVASVRNGMPDYPLLSRYLFSEAAKRAAE